MNDRRIRTFRALVVSSVLLYLLYFMFPLFRSALVPADQLEFLELNGFGAALSWPLWLQWGGFVANLGLLVGLYFFTRYTRPLFACLKMFFLAAGLGFGLDVSSAAESFLGATLTFLDGCIVTASFLQPVASKFEQSSPLASTTDSTTNTRS